MDGSRRPLERMVVPAVTVAALFVDPAGSYAGLPDVDLWDEARDARLYAGPYPVVAHPPCARWSIMGNCRGYRDGDDGGCFESALASVRAFGGVLEHPRHSLAWQRFAIPRPTRWGWTGSLTDDGWTCEVDQRKYGHRCQKPTWLYYVGDDPPPMRWGDGAPSSFRTAADGSGSNPQKRSATPPEFRDVLLAMARSASRQASAA